MYRLIYWKSHFFHFFFQQLKQNLISTIYLLPLNNKMKLKYPQTISSGNTWKQKKKFQWKIMLNNIYYSYSKRNKISKWIFYVSNQFSCETIYFKNAAEKCVFWFHIVCISCFKILYICYGHGVLSYDCCCCNGIECHITYYWINIIFHKEFNDCLSIKR